MNKIVKQLSFHHLISLFEGGSDIIDNAVALCPNCHREMHYSINKISILKSLYDSTKLNGL